MKHFLAASLMMLSGAGAPLPARAEPDTSIVVSATKATAMRDLRSVLGLVDGYVSRFDDSFCPQVLGLDADLTQRIEARVRANAARVGLAARDGCKPTAIAIFIERPRELMRALRDRRPDLFRLRGTRGTITAMIRREQPYYAWRAVLQRTADGRDVGAVTFAVASRIVTPARYDIVASYVVIDIEQIVGATTTQLADFATMQLLNNTQAEASDDTPAGSILGLFARADPSGAPPEMSAFDRGLLAGLYDQRLGNLFAVAQRSRIASRIAEEENGDR